MNEDTKDRYEREWFKMLRKHIESIRDLSQSEQNTMFWAICDYGIYMKEPVLTGALKSLWVFMIEDMKKNWTLYLNGIKGGAPIVSRNNPSGKAKEDVQKANQNLTKSQPKQAEYKEYKELKEHRESIGKERKKTFVPPTLQQIQDYIQENNLDAVAEAFHDYYESVGWKVGSGKSMKDWQAALRNWTRKERMFNQNNTFKYENNRTGNNESAAAERRAAAERVIDLFRNEE